MLKNSKLYENITIQNDDGTTEEVSYRDIHNNNTKEILRCIESDDFGNEVIPTMIAVCLRGSPDQYYLAHDIIERFIIHSDEGVRGIAVLCIGHIRRCYGKVELERMLPLLKVALQDKSDFVLEYANDSVLAISNYHNKKRIFGYLGEFVDRDLFKIWSYNPRTKAHREKMARIAKREAEIEHCCKELTETIKKYKGKVIDYDMQIRDYTLTLIKGKHCIDLDFCPFCGHKFSKALNSEYYDYLEEADIEGTPDLHYYSNVPEEFCTDEWWRKRGL